MPDANTTAAAISSRPPRAEPIGGERRWSSPGQAFRGALLATCLGFGLAFPVLGAPTSEYQLKAVFLFNFSQFVNWPLRSFQGPDLSFVIGVLGRDPFGATLDAAVQGEKAEGRPIVVHRFKTAADVTDCQILFIDRSESAALTESARLIRGRPILTVSDAPDAARLGAVIEFTVDNNRIRLRINMAEARARGLTISSKLLRPALVLDGGGD